MSSIEITRFSESRNNTRVGFASVKIPKWGLELNGLIVHTKNGEFWIQPPAQKYTKKDGTDGYNPYFRFEKEANERFQNTVIEELVKTGHIQKSAHNINEEDLPF